MKLTALNLSLKSPDQAGIHVLIEDTTTLANMVDADPDNQVLRRAYVRSSLALAEGFTDFLKQFTHDFTSSVIIPLQRQIGPIIHHCQIELLAQPITHTELALLRDEQARVKENGNIEISKVYLDFKTNLRFAITEFCKIFTITPTFDLSKEAGWSSLIAGAGVRNRIMHPKTVENVSISVQELITVHEGVQWLLNFYGSLMTSMAERLPVVQKEILDWIAVIQPALLEEEREFVAASPIQFNKLTGQST